MTDVPVIDARVVKRFVPEGGSEAFELNVHLRAGRGITVLLGANGAGKTQMLNSLAGFLRPDEGRILVNDQLFFDGETGVHLSPQQRECGYIFQDHALFPHMTIRENLRFAAGARGDRARRRNGRKRINDLLETFELADLAARRPQQLSGGQKQRAAIARALIGNPRLLLLDEPARGLDARLRQGFYRVLQKTRERLDVPVVLVTHDVEECFELADTVCFMEAGRFLQSGPKEQVFARPRSAEIARSLGLYDIFPAEIVELDPARNTSKLKVFDRAIQGPYLPGHLIGDRGNICVRSSDVRVLPPNAPIAQNQIELRVMSRAPSSHGVRLTLEHDITGVVAGTDYERLRGFATLYVELPQSGINFLDNTAGAATE